jgi:hypothetical protein
MVLCKEERRKFSDQTNGKRSEIANGSDTFSLVFLSSSKCQQQTQNRRWQSIKLKVNWRLPADRFVRRLSSRASNDLIQSTDGVESVGRSNLRSSESNKFMCESDDVRGIHGIFSSRNARGKMEKS